MALACLGAAARLTAACAIISAMLGAAVCAPGAAQTPPRAVPAPSAGPATAAHAAMPTAAPPLSAAAELGKQLFFDASLSASGKMSCASCHSPEHAYGPPNGLAVQLGGVDLRRPGTRAVPSLRYVLNRTPVWTHAQAASVAERLEETDNAPSGGFGWDGRFNRPREQAVFPIFNPDEMANRDVPSVALKLSRAPYAVRFRQVFGDNIFANPAVAVNQAMLAIERFEFEDPSFHPYTSKFDYYLDGKVALTAAELRGKKLFDDPNSGNCASCHIDQRGVDGSHPLFTDFTFEALGVPRNHELRVNADPNYFDMGLCGPLRTDKTDHPEYCGLFKTPGLRNVAMRQVFFHNGRFHKLADALRFYVQRDTDPAKWYSTDGHGHVVKFDDLPPAVRRNVDVTDEPLTRRAGGKPAWDSQDIEDVTAFLHTLDDGYPLAALARK